MTSMCCENLGQYDYWMVVFLYFGQLEAAKQDSHIEMESG